VKWLPTTYRLTMEDVNLIINDWEEEWKSPPEKIGLSEEEDDQDKSDEELSDDQGKDQTNGAAIFLAHQRSPKQDQKGRIRGKRKHRGSRKKSKAAEADPILHIIQ
jgi:hypothetical protein